MSRTDVAADIHAQTTAMACEISVQARLGSGALSRAAVDDAVQVFHDVDRTCTRFDPASDLMRANADGTQWVRVHPYCFAALVEAHAAYRRTFGRFDPRVLDDLVRLGYDESYTRRRPVAVDEGGAMIPRPPRQVWMPQFRRATSEVRIGPDRVDLGGIGKGLALRWAADRLRSNEFAGFLLDAGGDCLADGTPSDAPRWRIAVEDPMSDSDPIAVLDVEDDAIATSSVRVRQWAVGANAVHHLISPTDGLPGGAGLAAVTVVDSDPAEAEVWSKVLFLSGRDGIRTATAFHGLAALWVASDGELAWSEPMADRLAWTRR